MFIGLEGKVTQIRGMYVYQMLGQETVYSCWDLCGSGLLGTFHLMVSYKCATTITFTFFAVYLSQLHSQHCRMCEIEQALLNDWNNWRRSKKYI